MPNFAKSSAAVVRTTSLESQAQQIARASRNGRVTDTLITSGEVPPDVWQSMVNQGMANQSAWGPGTPINPTEPLGSEARQFEYMIGQNIIQRPRSTENVSFDTMRSIVEMYDVAQMAIEVRQDELRNLDWDIVADDERDSDKYDSEIRRIRAFFEKPDGHMLFDEMQNMLAYDWLAFDALTIFPRLTKGGKLGALEPADGTTFTPMIDFYGRLPESPAPAYVQWINGLPWAWFDRDRLIYRPHRRRTNKLYGFTPIEWLLNTINTDIRYQLYFLQYFTDGSVPDTWIDAPKDMMDPKTIRQFQEMYDTVMVGDQRQKHKVRFIPFGSKVTQAKDVKFDINFPQFMLTKTCAAFKVTPAELGFTEKVNKSSGESQENVQYRRSIRPSATFFANIYTGIIHKYFGLPNLRFKFLNVDEQEDMLLMAQVDEIHIRNAILSPDEVRSRRLGLEVDTQNIVPRGFVTTREGFVPIDDAIKRSKVTTQQLEAQVDQARTQAGEQPIHTNPADEVASADTGVEQDIEENEEAQKARMDFFVNPPGKNSIRTKASSRG